MASIAVVQTIYIALHLPYGQDWNKDETLSKHRHYFTQTKPALSEPKIPQIASLCDANQHSKMVPYTHRDTDTQMQITKNKNLTFYMKNEVLLKRKQQNSPPSLAKPAHRSVLCGSLLCWISKYWRSRHKTMHHTSKGERLGKRVLCSLKAVSCTGQNRYLFCTWKQMIFYSFFCWARLFISASVKKEEKKEKAALRGILR